ncbi:hypothetical protein T11_11605 [Trichinella zimbabwensis]|uniref:Uncharacterized protein n=1 Tax=Trichinella zimbabwensis TaxID=268475 RepID=A0A0V1HWP2_9BILA|nr:hypothetical protein T11_11605 [Trichinella zimbabwensis]
MGSIVVEKLPRGCTLLSLYAETKIYFHKIIGGVGAVALISCLVGEAAKPLPPPALAPAAAAAAEHAFTLARIVSVVLDFANSYFGQPLSELFKSNLRLQSLRRNFNEFIILVVDRVILAGFHFELLKEEFLKCRDFVQQQGFLCLVAREAIVNVFDVGLSFPFAFPCRNIAQNWQTVAIRRQMSVSFAYGAIVILFYCGCSPQLMDPTQAQHRNWKFC